MSSKIKKANDLANADFEIKCLELRKRGVAYWKIAKTMECDIAYVHKVVHKAIQKYNKKVEDLTADVILLEISRLDEALTGLWAGIQSGNPQSVAAMIKVMERRAKLIGLDVAQDDTKKQEGYSSKIEDIQEELRRRKLENIYDEEQFEGLDDD